MAKDPFEQFAIPAEMRAFAEQTVAQARKAVDGFLEAANKTMGSWGDSEHSFPLGKKSGR